VSEDELLQSLVGLQPGREGAYKRRGVSFADLSELAQGRGFAALGLELPLHALSELKVPVIVHLVYREQQHFSVLRSVAPSGAVVLADPSWGNRTLSKSEFAQLFSRATGERGRVLLIGRTVAGPVDHSYRDLSRGTAPLAIAIVPQLLLR
jgi:predicted double-glycine peptidase